MEGKLLAKLYWASQHIDHLQSAWNEFLKEDPYPITFETDPNCGNRIYKLLSVRDVPDHVSLIAGDAIHNLRSALDHVAHNLLCEAMGWLGPFPRVYFPVGHSAKEYKTGHRRKLKGIRKEAIDAIDDIQPYGGGSGEVLWHIHCLDIIDKHKVLLAGATKNRLHSMSPSRRAQFKQALGMNLSADDLASDARNFLTEPVISKFPLEAGDTLKVVPPEEVDDEMFFKFEVAFREPAIVKGRPIVETLRQASALVHNIIVDFRNRGFLE